MDKMKDSNTERDKCVGSSAIPCSYSCCQKALYEQRKQIRGWLNNILNRSPMNYDCKAKFLKEFDELKL